jgi:sugar-specific transcriptional regulator TrmB
MALMHRLQADLTDLGFTEYEARVYLSLLEENPATGYQISKSSGVPRSMVYEALGRLDHRGAVLSTQSGRATLYRPLPPDVLLERYEREHHELIDSLRAGLAKVEGKAAGERVWRILGQAPVHSYMLRMIEASSRELFLVLPDPELAALREAVVGAEARGVRVRALLTGQDNLDVGEVARHPSLESELQQLTNIALVEADHKQALIADTSGEVTATVTEDNNLVLIARQFVWMELLAQQLVSRLGEELFEALDPSAQGIFRELQAREV